VTDTPAWWIRRKNEHDVDYSQRLRVRGRALQVRLEAYETAVREWDEWGGKQHKEEPADAGWCSACGADWPCPSARLRDLSSQESE